MEPSKSDNELSAVKPEDTRTVTVKRTTKLVLAAALAILPSLVAFFSAGEHADDVKDKAESGYQFTKEAVTEIRESIKVLRQNDIQLQGEIQDLKRRARALAASKRKPEPPPPPPSPAVVMPAPNAPPLPSDLDKALVQQRATTTTP